MIGQTFEQYTILEKLGEGGMGVVYKALDTKLQREVALKFLPAHISRTGTERERFLQEARAAAAINHPNICVIYEIKEDGEQPYIAMEFVDGGTIRTMVESGPLKTEDAVSFGIQIGEALMEAHGKGIVHRDIKADNIIINSKRQVKVMDFGLAKLKGSMKLTKTSSTVGTLGYMAPEQIQGGAVDSRSDIFAFGVLFFEMLTGRLPFRGEHEAAMVYSIVNEDPEPIEKYLPDVSGEIKHILGKALEKDPADRYQSIQELVVDLRRSKKDSSRVSRPSQKVYRPESTSTANAPSALSVSPVSINSRVIIAIGALTVVIGAVYGIFFTGGITFNPNMSFRTLAIPFQEVGFPALSRDGSWVVFPGNARGNSWDLYLMNVNGGEPRQITNDSTGYMQNTDISPDGSQIVYDRSDKNFTKPEIATVATLGGLSKRIVDVGYIPKWRPDGERIGYIRHKGWGSVSGKNEIRSVKPNGTDDRLEIADTSDISGLFAWSPDGKKICWSRRFGSRHFELMVRDLESGKEERLTKLNKLTVTMSWTKQEEIIFSSDISGNLNLWAIPASGGTPVQITRGSGPDGMPAVSGDGERLVFSQEHSIDKVWLADLTSGSARQLTFEEADLEGVSISNDGKWITYVVNNTDPQGVTATIYRMDHNGENKRQIVSESANLHEPLWSPDDRWLIYSGHTRDIPHDSMRTYLIDVNGEESPKQVGLGAPLVWLDAKTFLTINSTGTWIGSVDGTPPSRYFRDSMYARPVLNGDFIVYNDLIPTRRVGVWLESSPNSTRTPIAPKQLIRSLGDYEYDPTSRSLLYVSTQNKLRRVSLPDGTDRAVAGTFPQLRLGNEIALANNGKRMVYLESKQNKKLVLIDDLR